MTAPLVRQGTGAHGEPLAPYTYGDRVEVLLWPSWTGVDGMDWRLGYIADAPLRTETRPGPEWSAPVVLGWVDGNGVRVAVTFGPDGTGRVVRPVGSTHGGDL